MIDGPQEKFYGTYGLSLLSVAGDAAYLLSDDGQSGARSCQGIVMPSLKLHKRGRP